MSVVVVGQGYVGLPLALEACAAGLTVVGLDSDPEVVDSINAGTSHVDDISDEDLHCAAAQGFRATSDPSVLASAEVVIVCVPTPLGNEGVPDLSHVISAGRMLGEWITPGTLCILESTTYPGTTEEVFGPLVTRDRLSVGHDVFIAYSPERIDPGNDYFGLKNTPKVVGGTTPACMERATAFYEKLVERVVVVPGPREAEMAKLIENTFRFVNIALVNEMVRFCDELNIDIWEALRAAATKPFGYMPFWPGPGVGGHCIPIDPSYLSHRVKTELGYPFRLVETAAEVNYAAPHYVATRVLQLLNRAGVAVRGATILLLGVTYKPNIADVRESPAIPVAAALLEWGADVRYHDPYVEQWTLPGADAPLRSVEDPYEAARHAAVVVLLQNHASYQPAALTRAASAILDTRGVLPTEPHVERL